MYTHQNRALLFAFVLFIMFMACAGGRNKDEEVDAFLQNSAAYYIKNGSEAINAGDYSKALPLFRQAIALTPFDPVAHNNLGVAFYHLGQLDSALAYYQAAIRLRPDYLRAISNLSKTYNDMGEKNYALAAAERITELTPDSALGYLLQTEVYERYELFDEAIHASQQALAVDPDHKDVRNNLGVLYFRSGRLDQAIASYQEVLAQDSSYAVAYFNLGNVLARKCLLEEAQFNYQRALFYNPSLTSAANNNGLIYLFMDRLEEASHDFHRALASDSSAPAIYYNLSIVQMRLDSLDRALTSIERAIALKPAIAHFFLQKGAVLERLHQQEAAVTAMQQAVAMDSTLSVGYNSLGNLMVASHPDLATEAYEKAVANYDEYMQRRYGRASQILDKGYFDLLATCKDRWQIHTDHAMVYNNLGKAYLQLKRYDQAQGAFAKAVELQPDIWEPAENLALVLTAQGNTEQARALIAQGRLNRARAALRADSTDAAESLIMEALRLQPRLQGSYGLLSQIYERKGNSKLAESTLRAGLKLYGKDAVIRQAYGRFLSRQGRFTEAKEQLLQAIHLDPKQDESRYLLAAIYRTQGDTERAEQEIARSHFILGQGYEEAGFFDRAMEEFRLAAKADPGQADYIAGQGMIFLKKRLYEEAENSFRQALRMDEKNVSALYGMGTLSGERGSHEQAVTWLKAAIAINPDNGQVHQALAVNYYFLGRLDSAREEASLALKAGISLNEKFLKAIELPSLTPR